jgi:hypothetical protein
MLEQKLDSAFRSTCRTLFKQELGSLEEFKGYLTTMYEPLSKRKSSVSKSEVCLSHLEYPKEGKFIKHEEIKEIPEYKLNVNEIKDIDSLVGAVKENFHYCGDKNLGKSVEVEESDACMDAGFVLDSHEIYDSQRVAYSSYLEGSKYIFGCTFALNITTMITAMHSYSSSRVFQTGFSSRSSDIYLSWYMIDCKECILSFNQRSKNYLVGNLELPKEEYFSLKEKLVGEIADVLKRKKTFPSLFEMAGGVRL